MAVRINDVLDYLEEHPIRRCNGSVESVLEMLLEAYSDYNLRDNRQIKELFKEYDRILSVLSPGEIDQIHNHVCNLCWEHEVLGFSHGILVGLHMMTEINYLT